MWYVYMRFIYLFLLFYFCQNVVFGEKKKSDEEKYFKNHINNNYGLINKLVRFLFCNKFSVKIIFANVTLVISNKRYMKLFSSNF